MAYTHWRRELHLREAQQIGELRGTRFWHDAMVDLAFVDTDMDTPHNVRMVAARAQQLKENAQ